MSETVQQLAEWIASLPEFGGTPTVEYKYERDGVPRYLVIGRGEKSLLKLYRDTGSRPANTLERGARDMARAEAAALREFAPSGLAPRLVWEGEIPPHIGGYGVIYRWVDGAPADLDGLTEGDVRQWSDALWNVHAGSTDLKFIAPHSRDLGSWWIRAHEQYREILPTFLSTLPPHVETALSTLTQSTAGDANAHKRFWQGGKLVPVHGSPALHNVVLGGGHVTLVDWSWFGLGDPAYELANAVWNLAIAGHETLLEELVRPYTEKADDVMLERRVMIYRRLLPYKRWLDLLSRRANGEAITQGDIEHGSFYLESSMLVYGWREGAIQEVLPDFAAWLAQEHVGVDG